MSRPAVFLDRDDTLIANREVTAATPHPGDLFEPGLVRLLPGVAPGLRRLKEAGFALVVVSNQGAVARGRCTIRQVEATNARMRDLIRRDASVELDAVYFCPYHPGGAVAPYNVEHPWRKPAPGMIIEAARALALDPARSWMIGDAPRDIESALRAGIAIERTVLIGDAQGAAGSRVPDFEQAVERILGRSAQ